MSLFKRAGVLRKVLGLRWLRFCTSVSEGVKSQLGAAKTTVVLPEGYRPLAIETILPWRLSFHSAPPKGNGAWTMLESGTTTAETSAATSAGELHRVTSSCTQ